MLPICLLEADETLPEVSVMDWWDNIWSAERSDFTEETCISAELSNSLQDERNESRTRNCKNLANPKQTTEHINKDLRPDK